MYQRLCANCDKPFKAKLERRVFCKDACRVEFNRKERLWCFYCGNFSSSRDHVYPHSVRTNMIRRNFRQEIVNACRSCNSTLGKFVGNTIESRFGILIERTIKQFQLDKQLPEWNEEEIEELGPALQSDIRSWLRERDLARSRVIHMRASLKWLLTEESLIETP